MSRIIISISISIILKKYLSIQFEIGKLSNSSAKDNE